MSSTKKQHKKKTYRSPTLQTNKIRGISFVDAIFTELFYLFKKILKKYA